MKEVRGLISLDFFLIIRFYCVVLFYFSINIFIFFFFLFFFLNFFFETENFSLKLRKPPETAEAVETARSVGTHI